MRVVCGRGLRPRSAKRSRVSATGSACGGATPRRNALQRDVVEVAGCEVTPRGPEKGRGCQGRTDRAGRRGRAGARRPGAPRPAKGAWCTGAGTDPRRATNRARWFTVGIAEEDRVATVTVEDVGVPVGRDHIARVHRVQLIVRLRARLVDQLVEPAEQPADHIGCEAGPIGACAPILDAMSSALRCSYVGSPKPNV